MIQPLFLQHTFNLDIIFMSFLPDLKTLGSGNIYCKTWHPETAVSAAITPHAPEMRNPDQTGKPTNWITDHLFDERIREQLGPLNEQTSTLPQLLNQLIQENSARNTPTADTGAQQRQSRCSPRNQLGTSRFPPENAMGSTDILPTWGQVQLETYIEDDIHLMAQKQTTNFCSRQPKVLQASEVAQQYDHIWDGIITLPIRIESKNRIIKLLHTQVTTLKRNKDWMSEVKHLLKKHSVPLVTDSLRRRNTNFSKIYYAKMQQNSSSYSPQQQKRR